MKDLPGSSSSNILLFSGSGEMQTVCRTLNWSQTSLGPVSLWPASLQTIVQTVLAFPLPGIVLWGSDLIQIYNDGYRKLIGSKHPDALGRSAREYWPEPWDDLVSIYQRVQTGASFLADSFVHAEEHGENPAAGNFKVVYSPVYVQKGEVGGMLVTFSEITAQVPAQKQLQPSPQSKDFLLLLSDVLRPLADPQAIQFEAVRALGEFLGANRAGYAETQQNKELVAVTKNYTHQVPSLEGVYSYADYGADLLEQLMAGQTVVRPDIANNPDLTADEKEAHAVLQLGATLNVPLVKEGHLIAILFVHFQQARNFTAQEVALAEETAERTWAAVERARLEADLRKSEQQLSAIVNQAMTGLARGNNDGTLTFVNQRYCQMLGYDASEILGRKMQDLTHPDDKERNVELYMNLVRTGEPFNIEKRYIHKNGTAFWVHNSVSALRDSDGSINQLLAVCTDITDRKHAESALKASEQKYRQLTIQLEARVEERTRQLESMVTNLKQSNDNLQQFAFIASHDLQEPLRKIQQFGDRLKAAYANSEKNGILYLERMLSAAGRMSTLINDLLNFSHVSTQVSHTALVPLDDLVKDVLITLEFTINEQKAQVYTGALPTIAGDASQLNQLFQNLISNALKFHRPGIPPVVEIKAGQVSASELPDWARSSTSASSYHKIEVTDNGIGFDEQYLDRIFKMFQRLHSKSEFEGTGIGLAICEKVVVNHGGAIFAHSSPGQGSTFIIFLPVTGTEYTGS
ncbi:PAS domain S-box protein [Dyadobacter flavalbus]|uniref:histidine kinase n=1 Tax=Dyadobacter flavalbus TaxID=2579942 RepID=A0A5M8QUF7_9BACT|nr:PAS domain S-box protein [Dyadobacter flavalbus]KAA6438464.1 PAS domain S-box protein [Dyadobacter flavalbus]